MLFPVKYSDTFYENLLLNPLNTFLAIECLCQPHAEGERGCPAEARVPGGQCRHRLVGVATGRIQRTGSGCRKASEGYITTLG